MPPAAGDLLDRRLDLLVQLASVLADVIGDGIGGAFADLEAVQVHARHAGLGGEGHELRLVRREFASANAVPLLGQHHNGAALGSFIRQRGKLSRIGQLHSP